jgi:hypothetical protein
MEHTKGKWIPDIHKYKKEPKEIIIGVMVETLPGYHERLFDTILPETDEEYIKVHSQIKANVELVCDAPNLLDTLLLIVNSPRPYNEREFKSWYETAMTLALEATNKYRNG